MWFPDCFDKQVIKSVVTVHSTFLIFKQGKRKLIQEKAKCRPDRPWLPPEHMVASDDIMRKENEVHL